MEKDESDGYFRATVDLADGIFHYQFKSKANEGERMIEPSLRTRWTVQTKSWFEQEPEPALPDYDHEEYKDLSETNPSTSPCPSSQSIVLSAQEEKQEKLDAHTKLIDAIRERNRQREHEATFTEIWYTFVDPYATDVDERGTGISSPSVVVFAARSSALVHLDDAHKAVGILVVKNGKRIIGNDDQVHQDRIDSSTFVFRRIRVETRRLLFATRRGIGHLRNSRGRFYRRWNARNSAWNFQEYQREDRIFETVRRQRQWVVSPSNEQTIDWSSSSLVELMPIKEYPGNWEMRLKKQRNQEEMMSNFVSV